MSGDPTNVIGRRIVAFFVDGGAQLLAFALVAWLLHVPLEATLLPAAEVAANPSTELLVASTFPLVYFVVFEVIIQGRLGWTPGKLFCGLRLVKQNGRAAGMLRAAVHAVAVSIAVSFGILGAGLFLALAWTTKGHRHPGDYLAGTYVIDSWSFGHELVLTPRGMRAGGKSVTRSDAKEMMGGDETGADILMARTKPNEPVYAKSRGTYIVWRTKEEAVFELDQDTKQWHPLG